MSWTGSATIRYVGTRLRRTAPARPTLAMGVAGIVAVAMIPPPTAVASPMGTGSQAAAVAAARPHPTTAIERRRMDRAPTPRLDWFTCYGDAQCATVKVPLDYDQPDGDTVELAVARVRARKPKRRIGSLFVNPGGPGGSGVEIALAAPYFLSDTVLDRFDVVGFDPRGVANSENLRCFRSSREQTAAYRGLNVAFPYTGAEERAYLASVKAVAAACSTRGRRLAGAMSTAEAARDMDLLRRAVGDPKLSYLGFSYGTALGQFYANMFPDRLRAVALDGVLDPTSWVGGPGRDRILDARLRSSDGAYRALREILVRCDEAGRSRCEFASGDPVRKFKILADRLRTEPAVVDDGAGGSYTVTYADFIGGLLGSLYSADGYLDVAAISQMLYQVTAPDGTVTGPSRQAARRRLVRRIQRARTFGFPYDNGLEAFSAVTCTDGSFPANPTTWRTAAAARDRRSPYFGRARGWSDAQCASRVWRVRDEDAYAGPFNRRTSAKVLIVGNFYDPATNYDGAVTAARLLPNSRLLSSDSWGHTAYGTSECVTGAVDRYLLRGTLPAEGMVCVGEVQPFAEPSPGGVASVVTSVAPVVTDRATRLADHRSGRAAVGGPGAGAPKQLPPVVAPIPPSILNGPRR